MSDADKRRNRIEEIGEENADYCRQERELERAENVELQKYCVKVWRTEETRRRCDLSRCKRNEGHGKNSGKIGEGTAANQQQHSHDQAEHRQQRGSAECSQFYECDGI